MKKFILLYTAIFFLSITAKANGRGSLSETGTACGGQGQPICNLTDCADPNDGFVDNDVAYFCGYSDDQFTGSSRQICAYVYNGGTYPQNSIVSCNVRNQAPINAGLIFLIIAGASAGFVTLKKHQPTSLNKPE